MSSVTLTGTLLPSDVESGGRGSRDALDQCVKQERAGCGSAGRR